MQRCLYILFFNYSGSMARAREARDLVLQDSRSLQGGNFGLGVELFHPSAKVGNGTIAFAEDWGLAVSLVLPDGPIFFKILDQNPLILLFDELKDEVAQGIDELDLVFVDSKGYLHSALFFF